MATTAERLKEAMKIRNMKQSELVDKTGISKGALSSYLSGNYEPKQGNIYKLAKVLHVNEAWLMGHDVPMDDKQSTNSKIDVRHNLKVLLNNYSERVTDILVELCLSQRLHLDLTEKAIAEGVNSKVSDYVSFEHDKIITNIDLIVDYLFFLFGFSTIKIQYYLLGFVITTLEKDEVKYLVSELVLPDEFKLMLSVMNDIETNIDISNLLLNSTNQESNLLANQLYNATEKVIKKE